MSERTFKVPRDKRLREKCVTAWTLYNENVPVSVIALSLGAAESTTYEYVAKGRLLVELERQHPGLAGSVT